MEHKKVAPASLRRMALLGLIVLSFGLSGATCGHSKEARRKAEAQVALCLEHFDERNYPQALRACMEGQDADPSYPEAYNAIGLIYLAQKRYPEAIEYFREGIEREEDNEKLSNARTNTGIALAALGRVDEAIEEFQKALSDDTYRSPDIALVNLCEAYQRKKQFAVAIDYCKQALERNRASCFAHYKLAEAYKEMGQTRTAIESYDKAAHYCPNWAQPFLDRGTARMKLKEFPQACADFWSAYYIDPESGEAQQAKRYIERIKCKKRPPPKKDGEAAEETDSEAAKNPRKKAQPLPYAR